MHAATIRRVAVAGLFAPLVAAQPVPAEDALDFDAATPDLHACLIGATERNPELVESRARYEAARHRASRLSALPDPVVSVTQALRSVETRVGPQRHSVTLSQTFPWFGARELRGSVALREAAALLHLHEAARRDLVARVRNAYYDLAWTDAALGLAEEERSLLEHYETLARARYATGQGLQQAVVRLQAEITRVLNRRHRLERERGRIAARWNALCDRPADAPVPRAPALDRPTVEIDREELYRLGELHRRELQAAGSLVEGSERSVELAAMRARPNFTASVGWIRIGKRDDLPGLPRPRDEGKDALTVSLGVSLPFWSAGVRAGVDEARDELRAHRGRRRAEHNAMRAEIEDAIVRIETLGRQLDLFDAVLIPQTGEALRATETAYETGQLGVLELLDSERTLIEVRTARARTLSDLLIAGADLERAIGTRAPHRGETR